MAQRTLPMFPLGTVLVPHALLPLHVVLEAELGDAVAPATTEVPDDPPVASYHAIALAPLGPYDTQRLLAIDEPGERLAARLAAFDDIEEALRLRLEVDPVTGTDGP